MGSEVNFDCGEIEVENKKENSSKSEKKHVCPYVGCQYSFNRPWKLNRHINTHTKQRPYKCDYPDCSKDYTNKSHLDRHKCMSHSGNRAELVLIPCPYPECNKVFMNKWSVKRHCNTHKNKDLFSCIQCGVIFKKSKQLKHHLYVHLGVKPFACDTCQVPFGTQKELKFHKKKHKIYTCDQQECKEQFNTWNALRKHTKLCHFMVYRCDSCSKMFKNKWTLTDHVLSHLPHDKRDVFACSYNDCKRFYFHQRNLEHHLKSFHQDINYKCNFENCSQSFVKKAQLKKHQILQHREKKILSERLAKTKKPRKPRCDKGQPKKSMAAMLSGLILPYHVDKNLAQNNITTEVMESIQNVRDVLLKTKENHSSVEENCESLKPNVHCN